jgi:hypothetical protein
MPGNADCAKCKNASGHVYSDKMTNNKLLSVKCKARDCVMYKLKDFYCWYN